jgi:hypothetical protein
MRWPRARSRIEGAAGNSADDERRSRGGNVPIAHGISGGLEFAPMRRSVNGSLRFCAGTPFDQ